MKKFGTRLRTVKAMIEPPLTKSALAAASYRSSTLLGILFVVLLGNPFTTLAQSGSSAPPKLPSAEKVVSGYLKAIGGKQKVAAVRDATCEWEIRLKNQMMGIARTQIKAPASVRTELS